MPLPAALKSPGFKRHAWYLATLALAFGGGGLFAWLAMPAGWLSGALVATALAALLGAPVGVEKNTRLGVYMILGTSMGSAITPETLRGITTWPVTMGVLAASVPVMMAAVIVYLEKVAGWDRRSAFFAAAPGALSTVLVMAESSGADTRRVCSVSRCGCSCWWRCCRRRSAGSATSRPARCRSTPSCPT